ncbi:MAG: divergent polysaccharide deacetylase family protein [Pseudomonadota bacterium]
MRFALLTLLVGFVSVAAAAGEEPNVQSASSRPQITVIIDDLGYSLSAGRRTIKLPGPVVCAVLPRTPRGDLLARLAMQNGKEVLLHLPLQSSALPGAAREPGNITLDMNRTTFNETLAGNLDTVPFAIGINGHKGSFLTRQPERMQWLMEEVAARNLLFVDSYTTHLSVALATARDAGVPSARRDVFLDSTVTTEHIAREFSRLKALARAQGSAVAIGHPHAETLTFLEAELPTLEAQGFELVGIQQLLKARHAARHSAVRRETSRETAVTGARQVEPTPSASL